MSNNDRYFYWSPEAEYTAEHQIPDTYRNVGSHPRKIRTGIGANPPGTYSGQKRGCLVWLLGAALVGLLSLKAGR